MSCGCGGSSAAARSAPRQAVRQAADVKQATVMPPFTDKGFVFEGPAGQQPVPAK